MNSTVFKKIRRKFYVLLVKIFSKIFSCFPYRLSIKLGGLIGRYAYYLLYSQRKIVLEQLITAFPDKNISEIKRIALEVFINQGKNLSELFLFPKIDKKLLNRITKIDKPEVFETALSKKKGVLIASAHCGNWELMGAALADKGFPINVIARKIYIDELNRILVEYRKLKGLNVILRSERGSAREMLRSIRNNEAIAMLIDQDTDVNGVFVDFFNIPAWTPSGLATLALKTGATVIIALDKRLKDDTHYISLQGPIEIRNSGDINSDIIYNTQMITKYIEDHIRENPSQWVWMHRRWKTKIDYKTIEYNKDYLKNMKNKNIEKDDIANHTGLSKKRYESLLVILFIFLKLFIACNPNSRYSYEGDLSNIPEQAIEDFTLTETKEGKTYWKMKAQSATIDDKKKLVYVINPKIDFYKDGKYISTLSTRRAKINTETYDIWAEDNCNIKTIDNEHLTTKRLRYQSDLHQILTDDEVTLIRPNEKIYGKGMVATPDLETIIIKNQRVEIKN